jgi:hypothetical protein
MKLQKICDKIKMRYDFPHILSDDFIIMTMMNNLPNIILNDECLGGLDIVPFEEMIVWPESFPVDFEYGANIILPEYEFFGCQQQFQMPYQNK